MSKPVRVERSEIVDSDPSNGRVKLADGRVVSHSRISIIAEASIEPEFVGIPYSVTKSDADMPQIAEMSTGEWINRSA